MRENEARDIELDALIREVQNISKVKPGWYSVTTRPLYTTRTETPCCFCTYGSNDAKHWECKAEKVMGEDFARGDDGEVVLDHFGRCALFKRHERYE